MIPSLAHFKIDSVGDVSVVEFVGPAMVEGPRLQELAACLHALVDRQGHRKIVCDFRNVQFLASSALGVMVTLQQKVEYHQGRLAVCGFSKELRQVFNFAQLDKLFAFCDTRDEALASFDAAAAE